MPEKNLYEIENYWPQKAKKIKKKQKNKINRAMECYLK